MSLPETLFINGTDLLSIPGLQVEDWSGLLVAGGFRGDNQPIAGMDGVVGTTKPRDAYQFSVPFHLGGEDATGVLPSGQAAQRAQFLANLAALDALFPTNLLDLIRRLTAAGSPGYADDGCNGEYLGRALTEVIDPATIKGVLTFTNLDGVWA